MNTAYDLAESAVLIGKLVDLTRDGKIEWNAVRPGLVKELGPATTRYGSTLEGPSEVLVWSTERSAGFRVYEKATESTGVFTTTSERDLISISMDHEDGPGRGQVYVNLMALLELARRSADKIEPKIERVKQYLDKLAV
jgi:hypothetical protein